MNTFEARSFKHGRWTRGSRAKLWRRAQERSGAEICAWLVVCGLLLALGGNAALALYWGDLDAGEPIASRGRFDRDGGSLVVYDLPPVTTSYRGETGTRTLKVTLGLELSGHEAVRHVRERLTGIVNRVAGDLSALDQADLNSAEGLSRLRRSLRRSVQTAAGDTPIEGVLFRELIVF